jgi:hypothetical protein
MIFSSGVKTNAPEQNPKGTDIRQSFEPLLTSQTSTNGGE